MHLMSLRERSTHTMRLPNAHSLAHAAQHQPVSTLALQKTMGLFTKSEHINCQINGERRLQTSIVCIDGIKKCTIKTRFIF